MNSIKKHPAHFSLNLGKLLLNNNGKNPNIIYCQLSDVESTPSWNYAPNRFQEFVIDACQLTNHQLLYELLTRLKGQLHQFTVRTLLINTVSQAQAIMPFLSYIRLIESTDLAVLHNFPTHKTRLACSSLEELQKVDKYRYYIYRNPPSSQMNLPFERIKCIQTPEYDISYYQDGCFIYSVYKQIRKSDFKGE